MALTKPKEEAVQSAAQTLEDTAIPGLDAGTDKGAAEGIVAGTHAASHQQATDLAVAQQREMAQVAANPAAVGGTREVVIEGATELQGLEEDGFSFPTIKQDKGLFKFGDNEELVGAAGKNFDFVIFSTRAKWLAKTVKPLEPGSNKPPKNEVVYVYVDPNLQDSMLHSGKTLRATIEEWKSKGWGVEIKRYLDVIGAVVENEGTPDQSLRFCTISVPPTSRTRVGGDIKAIAFNHGPDSKKWLVNFSAPTKVGEGETAFYPFQVKYLKEFHIGHEASAEAVESVGRMQKDIIGKVETE